jgi:hypothetical protein
VSNPQEARTATLEFTIHTDSGMRSGLMNLTLPGVPDVGYAIHAREVVPDHLDPLPLCWVAEGKQRGATVEDWEVSFDHEALPSFSVIDVAAFVTCQDCKEWLHA